MNGHPRYTSVQAAKLTKQTLFFPLIPRAPNHLPLPNYYLLNKLQLRNKNTEKAPRIDNFFAQEIFICITKMLFLLFAKKSNLTIYRKQNTDL